MQDATVAISHKPIASPGVFNQHIDKVGYMPPHSNAESRYQEQLAQRHVNEWQQQQQQQLQHQPQQPNMQKHLPQQPHAILHPHDRGTPNLSPRSPASQQPHSRAMYEEEPVRGIPIAMPSQQSITAQLPLHSRHSESEIDRHSTVHSRQPGVGVSRMNHKSVDSALPPPPMMQRQHLQPVTVGPQHNNMVHRQPVSPQYNQAMQYAGSQGPSRSPYHSAATTQDSAAMMMSQHQQHGQQPVSQHMQPLQPSPQQQCVPPPSSHVSQPGSVQSQGTLSPYSPQPSPVNVVVPVAESTPFITEAPIPKGGQHVASMSTAGSIFEQPGNIPAPPSPGASPSPMPRKGPADDDEILMHKLSATIHETVVEVNENERVEDIGSINSGLQSIPPDPNLECVVCQKVFKIGQIQLYKRHVRSCIGSK